VIGPKDRAAAYSPALEEALLHTVPGMADYADLGSPHVCGGCAHWRKATAAKGRCAEYSHRMQGRRGALIKSSQRACGALETIGALSTSQRGERATN
jgi:hypothetical protein